MNDVLAYFLLALLAAVLLLQLVQLLRRGDRGLENALRDEQREGRGELRQQLDSLSAAQEQRIQGFGGLLNSMASNNDQRMEDLRETLTEDARKARGETALALRDFAAAVDARVAELARNNELRLGEMRT